MFGQPTGFGGFGQTQPQQAPSPFGATPAANPFGATAFGQPQQAPAFGGGMFGQASAPAFGAATAPAFGAAAAPAFGAQQARPAFGASFGAAPTFGASQQPAFGSTGAPAFGMQQSQGAFGVTTAPTFGMAGASSPAFGAASVPAFGAATAPAFGAPNPFGGSTFGSSSPAFGATSAPAFGMSAAPAFGAATATAPFGGTGLFGAATSPAPAAFGAQQQQQGGLMFGAAGTSTFGMQQPQQPSVGTRMHAYQKTVEKESSAAGGSGVPANYITLTAMPAYINKSQEELRWEDYQQGVKSAAAGPPQQPAGGGLFGTGGLTFGTPQAAAPTAGFGTGAFGASAPGAFGVTQSAPAFGSPASAPAFGAPATASFGFGSAASPPAFGAAPAAGFFGASTAAFGQSQATGSIFGSAPAFSSTPSIFGTPGAGSFGAPAASSAGMFSFNTSPSLFSTTQAATAPAQPNLFGTTQPNMFGTTMPSFSAAAGTSSLFPASQAPGFGANAFAPKPAAPFSFSSAPAANPSFASFSFSSAAASSPGLFGAMTSTAFAPATAAAQGPFGFASSPGLFSSPVPGFGQVMSATAMAQAQGPAPSVGQAPYGAFPALPAVSEPKVGIGARPVNKNGGGGGGGALRNSPLLSLRSAGATPRFGVQVRNTAASPLALISASPVAAATGAADTDATRGAFAGSNSGSGSGAPGGGALLPARANPHRLFIREPPPGTESAGTSSPVLAPLPSPGAEPRGGASPEPGLNGSNGHAAARGGGAGADARARPPAADSPLPRLGRLASEGYTYEPSAVQLAAMAASDPDSLRAVSGFTVARRGFGQVRWLRPVDVTGLELQRIVTIGEGEVFCYSDEDKPPVGQGLNTDAEVTLYNVYKLDSKTKQPVREGPAVLKWEKALRSMCAKMNTKFVMYKAEGGVWKFEVEHFSRYGLLDIEEDDDNDDEEAAQEAAAAGRKLLPVVRYGLAAAAAGADSPGGQGSQGMSGDEADGWLAVGGDEPRDDDLGYAEEEQEEERGAAAAAAPRPSGFGTAASPLQHSLPLQLNLDPSGLMALHGSLFVERMEVEAVTTTAVGPTAAAAAAGLGGASARHPWRRRAPPPLTSSAAGTRALLCKEPASPAAAALTAAPLALRLALADRSSPGPSPGPSSAARGADSARRPGAGASAAAASACFVDAGLCLGPSFRVGWGPGGKLVYPGNLPQSHLVHSRRVMVEGWATECEGFAAGPGPGAAAAAVAPAPRDALRQQLLAALQVHRQHSCPELPAPGPDGSGAGASTTAGAGSGDAEEVGAGGREPLDPPPVPLWSLRCDRRGLPRLVEAYLVAPDSDVAQLQLHGSSEASSSSGGGGGGSGGGAVEQLLLRRHEAETWRLVQALWEHIEGEDDSQEGGDAEMRSTTDVVAGQAALAAFRRRRGVSRWLRRQAKGLVEAELGAVAAPAEAVLRLAAAGQAAAAAAVAVAAGDVRLATLLAQAGDGARSELCAEVSEQLAVWERSDMVEHVAHDRLLVYRLLAGQVDEVRDRLKLDWRRYLALFLSYAIPPTASPAQAVQLYCHALSTDRTAPRPVPPYADERGSLGRCRPRETHAPGAADLHHELLRLWAAAAGNGGDDAPSPVPALAPLLQAAAHSPNPLAAGLSWHLLTTLQALAVLPSAAAADGAEEPERGATLLSVHLDFITQLALVGDMGEWAVYVALHVPEPAAWPGLRTHLVQELLTQYCPEWLDNEAKTHFLTESLCLPQALLSKAEAVWARYSGDDVRRCGALLASGAWSAAHDLLTTSVAPLLFLAGRTPELRALLDELAPRPGAGGVSPRVPGPEWEAGGGLYLAYLRLFGGTGPGGGGGGDEEVREVLVRLQAAGEKLAGAGAAAAAAAADPAARQQRLRQQLVLSRMAARLYQAVMAPAAGGEPSPAALARKLGDMQGILGLYDTCLPADLKLPGVAAAATAVTAAATAAMAVLI